MRNYRKKRVHLPGVIALCLTLILGSLPSVSVLAAEAGMTESTVIAGESGSENAEQQEENSSVPSEEEQAAPEEEQAPAEEEPVLTESEPAEEQTPAETISDDSETSASESMTSEPAEAVVSMPAVELRKEIEDKGITVIVQAEEGTFPEGTVLEAEWVDDKEILDRITEAAREAALKLKAEQAAAEGQTEQDAEAADSAEESVSADVCILETVIPQNRIHHSSKTPNIYSYWLPSVAYDVARVKDAVPAPLRGFILDSNYTICEIVAKA